MTELLKDIWREPGELLGVLDHTLGAGRPALDEAARLLGAGRDVFVTGIGSSWNAALGVGTVFESGGRPCRVADTSELLEAPISRESTVVVLSRSGRSYEVVALIPKVREAGARLVAITNTVESPLAQAADAVLRVKARPDHLVSVTMYSGLALVGGLLAERCTGPIGADLRKSLETALRAAGDSLDRWAEQLEAARWLAPEAPVYFLGRRGSLATCHEARLLWEEAAKAPATALSTSGFRHGSQEIVRPGLRVGMWIQPEIQRGADLRLASELRAAGAEVLIVGQALADDAAGLAIEIPPVPAEWQFLLDVIPAQLAAEQLSRLRGQDCDAFRYCPYIIDQEAGLTGGIAPAGCGTARDGGEKHRRS